MYISGPSRQDTFTAAGQNGTAIDATKRPAKSFSLQVKGTVAAPTSWTVVLQGSLDGTNWTTILTHTNTSEADGAMLSTGAAHYPAKYFRSRCEALVLGGATNVVVEIVGLP